MLENVEIQKKIKKYYYKLPSVRTDIQNNHKNSTNRKLKNIKIKLYYHIINV
jgi:hypothetical protein